MEAHRCHDYRHLITRWRRVARACGLELEPLAKSGGETVYFLQTPHQSADSLYLSAGIHGDEPAAAAGLLVWAEEHLFALMRRDNPPFLIFPCLNPWGLVHNQRVDAGGVDLNRHFNRNNLTPVAQVKRLIGNRRFAFAAHLHEDYDAQGTYVYELHNRAPDWGQSLLEDCRPAIPPDPRRRIDGRVFDRGVFLRRRVDRIDDHPEALHLYLRRCPHVLTFETPSEFALERRIRAQVLLLEACTRRLLAVWRKHFD